METRRPFGMHKKGCLVLRNSKCTCPPGILQRGCPPGGRQTGGLRGGQFSGDSSRKQPLAVPQSALG